MLLEMIICASQWRNNALRNLRCLHIASILLLKPLLLRILLWILIPRLVLALACTASTPGFVHPLLPSQTRCSSWAKLGNTKFSHSPGFCQCRLLSLEWIHFFSVVSSLKIPITASFLWSRIKLSAQKEGLSLLLLLGSVKPALTTALGRFFCLLVLLLFLFFGTGIWI